MTGAAVTRRIIGVALMVDGMWAAMRMSGLLSSLGTRDLEDVAMIVARMFAGAAAVAAGWFVTQRRPAGPWMAQTASLATVCVLAVGMTTGWLPTSIDPGLRNPVIAAYAVFALVVRFWARREMRREDK